MHDIDRTTFETGYGEYESEEFENDYESGEFENDYEFENDHEFEDEYEDESQSGMYGESPFSEAEEMELALELLNVSNEQELDQFIGKLFSKAGKALGMFVNSPVGKQLGGIIKGAAKSALPMLGGALGNFLLPGVGGAMGGKLGAAAGSMLGLELEGLSQEDQEFEVARQLVRFGGATVSNAADTEPTTPPQQAAQTAAVAAARQYAPGLLKPNANDAGGRARCGCNRKRRSGHWIRKGNKITIFGV